MPSSTKPSALMIAALTSSVMLLLAGCDGAVIPELGKTIKGQIVGVHDGDSCTLLTDAKEQFKIRIDGIDASELGQPHGRQGKAALSGLEMFRQVTVQDKGKARYGRTLGVVMVNGQNVNLEMVRLGYGWH